MVGRGNVGWIAGYGGQGIAEEIDVMHLSLGETSTLRPRGLLVVTHQPVSGYFKRFR